MPPEKHINMTVRSQRIVFVMKKKKIIFQASFFPLAVAYDFRNIIIVKISISGDATVNELYVMIAFCGLFVCFSKLGAWGGYLGVCFAWVLFVCLLEIVGWLCFLVVVVSFSPCLYGNCSYAVFLSLSWDLSCSSYIEMMKWWKLTVDKYIFLNPGFSINNWMCLFFFLQNGLHSTALKILDKHGISKCLFLFFFNYSFDSLRIWLMPSWSYHG